MTASPNAIGFVHRARRKTQGTALTDPFLSIGIFGTLIQIKIFLIKKDSTFSSDFDIVSLRFRKQLAKPFSM